MLHFLDAPSAELFATPANELINVIPGPTLVRITGGGGPPLFVSVLLHGNETSGWHAVCDVFRRADPPPRDVLLFIGNVAAAAQGQRTLQGQQDFNRIWRGADGEEGRLAEALLTAVRREPLFAAIDLHNNTGRNPHYSVLTHINPHTLGLGYLFSEQAVFVEEPDTVLARAMHEFCPAVTLEVGPVGDPQSDARAARFLDDCLNLTAVPQVDAAAMKLYRSLARVHVPESVVFDFVDDVPPGMAAAEDLILTGGMEAVNFHPVAAGTEFAALRAPLSRVLAVLDTNHRDVTHEFFEENAGVVTLRQPVVPAMYTTDHDVIRQDCLCYFMEQIEDVSGLG